MYKRLENFSMGIGDRFGLQGEAQLDALEAARQQGIPIVPVWNKSNREHEITSTHPESVRSEADNAVQALDWQYNYYVDADHISLDNVDKFISSSDFFTLDVADYIGVSTNAQDTENFVSGHKSLIGSLEIDGLKKQVNITEETLRSFAEKYLYAVRQAGKLYRHIVEHKKSDEFVTEVSMDETATPQSPVEILLILAAVAEEGIPAQTVAPKFSGQFNKGIDYVGDITRFGEEFRDDVAVTKFAGREFDVPDNVKLSMHSGSDKFSLYPVMRRVLQEFDAGVHLKTAGTTWLEEVCGLAAAGGDGLALAKSFYCRALDRYDELCGPYAPVLDIDKAKLPASEEVEHWNSEEFVNTLLHDPEQPAYNPHFRQLLHVAYKLAAEAGTEYRETIAECADQVHTKVRTNLLERHIIPLFY